MKIKNNPFKSRHFSLGMPSSSPNLIFTKDPVSQVIGTSPPSQIAFFFVDRCCRFILARFLGNFSINPNLSEIIFFPCHLDCTWSSAFLSLEHLSIPKVISCFLLH